MARWSHGVNRRPLATIETASRWQRRRLRRSILAARSATVIPRAKSFRLTRVLFTAILCLRPLRQEPPRAALFLKP